MADYSNHEHEKQVKKLKRKLEGWREIILPLHSVLIWDKHWYPGMTFGVISILYFFLWLFDPPIFTIVAALGLIITLLDYLVPVFISHFYARNEWNKNKEKLFEEICKNIVICYNWIYYTTESFYKMRDASPRVYYAILIAALSFSAWMGATTSNLFLSYLTTLYISMLPGLLNNNLVGTKLAQLAQALSHILQPQIKAE